MVQREGKEWGLSVMFGGGVRMWRKGGRGCRVICRFDMISCQLVGFGGRRGGEGGDGELGTRKEEEQQGKRKGRERRNSRGRVEE